MREMVDVTRRILWIHGWGMSPWIWESSVREQWTGQGIGHHFFSYADCHSIEAFYEAFDRVLREVKPETVVGWSMGGMLAVDRLAQLAGEMGTAFGSLGIKRLVVIGSTLCFVSADRKQGWPRRIVERMLGKLETDREHVLQQFADSMVSANERAEGKIVAACEPDFSLEGLKAGLKYLIETDVTEAWSKALVPVFTSAGGRILWIHGSGDAICPVGAMPDETEGVRSVVLEDTGHVPFLTRQAAFYEHLRGFLDDDKDR
ncbi:alpha/beta hydrolase [Paenibacillus naphthalenovorans]|uniref:Alpha/beta hydrolase n=2 Tax=Paenibacillus TaxID=44249 RepID=A0A0U2IN96_9BACL|nr:alpha/beta hydrolase [Paenibacillus naphthalenovorans]